MLPVRESLRDFLERPPRPDVSAIRVGTSGQRGIKTRLYRKLRPPRLVDSHGGQVGERTGGRFLYYPVITLFEEIGGNRDSHRSVFYPLFLDCLLLKKQCRILALYYFKFIQELLFFFIPHFTHSIMMIMGTAIATPI